MGSTLLLPSLSLVCCYWVNRPCSRRCVLVRAFLIPLAYIFLDKFYSDCHSFVSNLVQAFLITLVYILSDKFYSDCHGFVSNYPDIFEYTLFPLCLLPCYWSQGKVMFSPQLVWWLLGHCSSLLQRGRYASYWNAFLFVIKIVNANYIRHQKVQLSQGYSNLLTIKMELWTII